MTTWNEYSVEYHTRISNGSGFNHGTAFVWAEDSQSAVADAQSEIQRKCFPGLTPADIVVTNIMMTGRQVER